ncbi:uncharacterized protein LOC113146933 [Cyclospora cayetanensis]|uniref:Uncharacterized protein LOC113146933 n=1 Tax=Cyclospora cayetanensis TaxID=88456 RepID=A0A6P6RWN6_9EIME|nr:uncharacterized protein LOC113146933 [Cyclospora cayetanensis]
MGSFLSSSRGSGSAGASPGSDTRQGTPRRATPRNSAASSRGALSPKTSQVDKSASTGGARAIGSSASSTGTQEKTATPTGGNPSRRTAPAAKPATAAAPKRTKTKPDKSAAAAPIKVAVETSLPKPTKSSSKKTPKKAEPKTPRQVKQEDDLKALPVQQRAEGQKKRSVLVTVAPSKSKITPKTENAKSPAPSSRGASKSQAATTASKKRKVLVAPEAAMMKGECTTPKRCD